MFPLETLSLQLFTEFLIFFDNLLLHSLVTKSNNSFASATATILFQRISVSATDWHKTCGILIVTVIFPVIQEEQQERRRNNEEKRTNRC